MTAVVMRRAPSNMAWSGLGIVFGAGLGLLVGLLLAGGVGIAFGLTFGAGIGLVVGSAIDSRCGPTPRQRPAPPLATQRHSAGAAALPRSSATDHINPFQEDDMKNHTTATVDEALRLGNGFGADERTAIVDMWASLDERLLSFDRGTVELELSVKERGQASQRTVLEARISGQAQVVATSSEPDLARALHEVRDDLIRQLTDAKNQTEPRNNAALRGTIRREK